MEKENKKVTKKTKDVVSTNKIATKKTTSSKNKKTTKKVDTKSSTSTRLNKTTTKKETTPKKTSSKKTTTKKSTKKATTKKTTNYILEYYDLPYRYNETIVKILAQTPTTLFVYWDISDKDRQNYINEFGQDFFEKTKPILVIHNVTKNYIYEIEINDFANSWYLRTEEPNCNYEIALGRRSIAYNSNKKQDFIIVTSSNLLETPNDHILLENVFSNTPVSFKNVKTNTISTTNYGSLTYLPNMNKFYSVKEFYNKIYKEEMFVKNDKPSIHTETSSY